MSNKARKFKSKNKSNFRKVRRLDRRRHLASRVRSLKPEVLERNLSNVLELSNESFVSTLDDNVAIVNDFGIEVNKDARKEAEHVLAQTAINETMEEVLVNEEEKHYTPSRFLSFAKSVWRRNLDELKEEGKSFFSKLNKRFAGKSPVRGTSVLENHRSSILSLKRLTQQIQESTTSSKVKILNNKYVRRLSIAATVSAMALVVACTGKQQPQNSMPIQNDSALSVNNLNASSQQAAADTIQFNDARQQVQADSVVFTPFNANNPLHQFCEKTFANIGGWEGVNKALTNQMMEEHFAGKTRDEVLNALRFVLSKPSYEVAHGEEYRIASELASYLNNCDENAKMPENVSKIFIEQFKGDRNIQVTGANPCDQTISTKRLKSVRRASSVKVKENVKVADADTVVVKTVEQPQNQQMTFEDAASTLETDTVYQNKVVQDSVQITKFKANEDLKVQDSDNAFEQDVLGLSAKKTDVNIEKDSLSQQTSFIEEDQLSGSGISEFKGNGLSDVVTTRENVSTNEVADLQSSSSNVQIEYSVTNAEQQAFEEADSFVEVTDTAQFTSTSTLGSGQAVFYSPSSRTDTLSVNLDKPSSDSIVTDNSVVSDSVTVKILADSDTISVGTPGAGHVAERGGYQNSGVTKEQDDYSRKKLGDFYDLFIENTPKEAYAKGGIYEGLSPEQAAYAVAVIAVTDPHGEAMHAILKSTNCEEELTLEEKAAAKSAVDGVHKNKTRDGWTYSKRIYVDRVNNNGCGKRLTLKQWRTRRQKPTTASGPKFDRYFEQRGVIPRQTAFEEAPSTLSVQYQHTQNVVIDNPTVTQFKSNEDLAAKQVSDATVQDVLNTQADKTDVLIEKAENPAVKAKKRVYQNKKLAQTNETYQKQAKEHGLSGNLALDSHAENGAEFIKSFFKDRKVTFDDLNNYQVAVRKAYEAALADRAKS